MNVLINHICCRESIWGGIYGCRVLVTIDMCAEDKGYYDPHEPDWLNLLEKHPFDNSAEPFMYNHTTLRLKPEVMKWLEDNIKDVIDRKGTVEKGWAVGTDKYNSIDRLSFSVFFQRQPDAMKFIKRWSSYKKPVDYLNYFKDIRRKLDLTTNTLRRVER